MAETRRSTAFVSMMISGLNLVYSLGSIACGSLVERFGRKPVLVSVLLATSVLIISFSNMRDLWLSTSIILIAYALIGVAYPASNSLTLEQVPRFRGTMMSLNSAAENLGMALGSGVGGLVLLAYDYELLGISLGALGIVAVLIYHARVIDPTETHSNRG